MAVSFGLLSPPHIPPITEHVQAAELTLMEEAELNIRTFTKEELKTIAIDIADEYGVSHETMFHIVDKESQWVTDARGDLDIICNNPGTKYHGTPVTARGLPQITRCYYPEITDEQADNPYFSLRFLASKLSEGVATCRSQFSTCPL